jgi:hypothetical protein
VHGVTIGDIPHCTCHDFMKNVISIFGGKKERCVLQTFLLLCSNSLQGELR